ncbi:MAG TPA: immunoglobulin domain-containing protein, partial [Opitutaceae bacterium]|nr:immunoglobulin domain-containing protein [Opitutaceae bacterium]
HQLGRVFAITVLATQLAFLQSRSLAAVTPDSIEVGDGYVVRPILVEEPGSWTVVSHASWLSVPVSEGYGTRIVEITAERNTTGADRTASITFGASDVMVTQRAAGSGLRELWVMGDGSFGQRGDTTSPFRTVPAPVMDDVLMTAAGDYHSLFLKTDGTLWTMGDNQFGQLGDGTTTDRATPVQVASDVTEVAAGSRHSLFVKTDGTLWAMGDKRSFQMKTATTVSGPTPVRLASDVSKVAGGGAHSLFVKTDGTLWGLGHNFFGQLGDGSNVYRALPVQVATGVAAVAAGQTHSLFTKTDGTLWAMGSNEDGELGNHGPSATPVQMASDVVAVAAGYRQTLFAKNDGTLWVMGSNLAGQLGDGTTTDRHTPVQLASNVTTIAAGTIHTLFVKADGTLWAMGANHDGQLGDGSTSSSFTPVQVASGIATVSAGGVHSLIVSTGGQLRTVGGNLHGQLGDGSHRNRTVPVQVASGVEAADAGNAHGMFVKTDATLWAMGDNRHGQLGDGSFVIRVLPVQVATEVASARAGAMHSLFVKTDGTLWAMGNNQFGQLGDGTTTDRPTPVQVASGVTTAAAGGAHSLFVKTDGTLWAMGWNIYGQLGDGSKVESSVPIQVASGVAAASAGSMHSLFLKTDGTLWMMGWNLDLQLAFGLAGSRRTPVLLASDVAFAAEGMFVKTDGTLWAMGYDVASSPGEEKTQAPSSTLIATNVSSASAGFSHRLFTKSDGTLWGIGHNWYGALGDGTNADPSAPVPVASGVISATAGSLHSLFVATGDIGVPPQVISEPVIETMVLGGSATLTADVTGTGPLTYQWKRNGTDIPGATDPSLTLANLQAGQEGSYSVVVSNFAGSATGTPAILAIDTTPRLINVSARAFAGEGDGTLILGFHISGTGEKTVLIRGVGPRLAFYNVPGVVADPMITLYSADTVIGGNDDWDPWLAADFAAIGAFALESGSKDSALKVTLPPGGYTVHLLNGGPVAEAMLEVYDLSRDLGSRITNVSSRVKFEQGRTAILGFGIVAGQMPVLVRAVGPELANYGIPADEVLADPHLRIYRGHDEVAVNDDWAAETGERFAPAGAFPLDAGSKDAAIRAQFLIGGYTVHSTGNGGEGVAIIEIYESP